MIGPRPIETVGNSQNSGISQGCGYDDSPPPGCSSRRKLIEVLLGEPAFEKRAGVHAGRRVALEINLVAVEAALAAAAEEVVERHFVQRGRRGERRDVPADAGEVAVGARDHRHRVPADEALDPPLQLALAGIARLLVARNRVDVRRGGRERQLDAVADRRLFQRREQLLHALRALALQHVVERLEPLGRLGRIDVVGNRRVELDRFGCQPCRQVLQSLYSPQRHRDTENDETMQICDVAIRNCHSHFVIVLLLCALCVSVVNSSCLIFVFGRYTSVAVPR